MLRRRRDKFRAAYDVRYFHQMIVNYVREIVRGHAVALQQNLILKFGIGNRDVAMQYVKEGRFARQRHFLSDYVG